MEKLKVIRVLDESIELENGVTLSSYHRSDCCEYHYLNFEDLDIKDFDGLEFDLSNDNFFKRVEGYGIRLVATNGVEIPIAGHGSNNGYYSSNLELVLSKDNKAIKVYDIIECQDY